MVRALALRLARIILLNVARRADTRPCYVIQLTCANDMMRFGAGGRASGERQS